MIKKTSFILQFCFLVVVSLGVFPVSDTQAKHILAKTYVPPQRAEVWHEHAQVYLGANANTHLVGTITGDIVIPVVARGNDKIDAWGNTAYWFEILWKNEYGWVLGNQLNFLRLYQNQDALVNKYLKTHARTQPREVYFFKIDLNADDKLELVLQWREQPANGKSTWHVAIAKQVPSGLASGGISYKTLFKSEQDKPLSIWFEDVDMDKRMDVVLAYSSRQKYAIDIVKWIHVENKIRLAFNAEVFRKNAGSQINLITRRNGRVDVEVISRVQTNPPKAIRKYYKPQPGGTYNRVL